MKDANTLKAGLPVLSMEVTENVSVHSPPSLRRTGKRDWCNKHDNCHVGKKTCVVVRGNNVD